MAKALTWVKLGTLIGLMMMLVMFVWPAATFAQLENVLPSTTEVFQGSPGLLSKFGNIKSIIGTVFNFIIIIAGTIFVILLLIGGVQYLTSAGNEEGTTKAKRLMIDAIIGLVITLSAWAIGIFILGRLGFSGVGGTGGFGSLPYTVRISDLNQLTAETQRCNQANGTLNLTTPPDQYTCR